MRWSEGLPFRRVECSMRVAKSSIRGRHEPDIICQLDGTKTRRQRGRGRSENGDERDYCSNAESILFNLAGEDSHVEFLLLWTAMTGPPFRCYRIGPFARCGNGLQEFSQL